MNTTCTATYLGARNLSNSSVNSKNSTGAVVAVKISTRFAWVRTVGQLMIPEKGGVRKTVDYSKHRHGDSLLLTALRRLWSLYKSTLSQHGGEYGVNAWVRSCELYHI